MATIDHTILMRDMMMNKYRFKKILHKQDKRLKPGEEQVYSDGTNEDFDTVKKKYEYVYEKPGGTRYGRGLRIKEYNKLLTHYTNTKICVKKNITSVLDIGTGKGAFCEWAYHNICKNIYGLDFASELSQECIDLDIKFIKANAHEIPLPDKSIDLITSFDFLEHVHPDYLEKTINEMKRVGCKYMFHKIARGPSAAHHKKLGQLHLIQEDPEFWIEQVFRPDFSNVQWCGGGTFFIII